MTELSFLLELLLNHKLRKETKDAIKSRIKVVEERQAPMPQGLNIASHFGLNPYQPHLTSQTAIAPLSAHVVKQAPSTLAAMMRHGILPEGSITETTEYIPPIPEAPPVPVTQIAQTGATAQAMMERQAKITNAINGNVFNAKSKLDDGRRSPRKF